MEHPSRHRSLKSLSALLFRILCWLVPIGVVAYLGICAAFAWENLAFRRSNLYSPPSIVAPHYQNIHLVSSDGTPILGWLFIPTVRHPRGLIILCHGHGDNRCAVLPEARVLYNHGYAALVFDFRNSGVSGGRLSTLGRLEVNDLLAVVSWTQTQPALRRLPIGVFGVSMGGAVSLMATARTPVIRAVIAESPFARLDHAVNNDFWRILGPAGPEIAAPVRWFGEWFSGAAADSVWPAGAVGRIAPRPLLLIQDDDDPLCPPAEGVALYRAARAPKTLWTIAGAGHVGGFYREPRRYSKRLIAFFDQGLKATVARS